MAVLAVLSVLAVASSAVNARMLAKGRILYVLPLVSGLCVACIDLYAAVAHPEQISFILFSFLGTWQTVQAILGIRRHGLSVSVSTVW